MDVKFKSESKEGECNVEGCFKSKANGDRMVYHHAYETNVTERERYKHRVKTPISRLKESKNKNVQERNEEERRMCKTVCVHHHSILHATLGQEESARKAAELAETVQMGMVLFFADGQGRSEEEVQRVRKKLRRRLAQLN
jgi:hypothetical protein